MEFCNFLSGGSLPEETEIRDISIYRKFGGIYFKVF